MTETLRAYTQADATPVLQGTRIAVIGYGSQGRAHAMNLHDSGLDVVIGARPDGPSHGRAMADGFEVASPVDAAKQAQFIAMTAPDMAHREIFQDAIAPNLDEGDTLMFAHGFSVLYGHVRPPKGIDVILVAPKGPGDLVRKEYERDRGVPCLFAVHQDATGKAHEKAIAYAHGLGGTRAALFETSFKDETETDLFGEQAVLCGGATELVKMGYETLVEAGYPRELAYYECLHELKLIVDLLYEGGITKMHEFISETAIYGDLRSGRRIINEETRERMRTILSEIQSGQFAREWDEENAAGRPVYNQRLQEDFDHSIEEVGKMLRGHMTWLQEDARTAAMEAAE
ncbi:ketol-acid reductoisomerase [Parvularcula maris]|uniref:Ketol-acid reductoisomerase (NADP(+)) n=1 Tax=Parvularcula maris TaxID=2965077 RepID=A0A9X2L7F6_9PROT|nr:ketol-acid reductoisomerase [Parvularcula maris]MCQ8184478.1 ketol-acid reductoisomerase [Parvularcula maris]